MPFRDPVPRSTAGDTLPRRFQELEAALAQFYVSTGSPEGAVRAAVGSLYLRLDGGTTATLYIKETSTTSTGWVAK